MSQTLVAASGGIMFEKSLQDLVKGIRANKRDPSAFISQAIAECKTGQSARAARSLTHAPPPGARAPHLTRAAARVAARAPSPALAQNSARPIHS